MSERYVIAVKRTAIASVPCDWQNEVRRISGLEILGGSPRRILVAATPEAIEQARTVLGVNHFFVESAIGHRPLAV